MSNKAQWRTLNKDVNPPFGVYVGSVDKDGDLYPLRRRENHDGGELVQVVKLHRTKTWVQGRTDGGREVIFGGVASKCWILLPDEG